MGTQARDVVARSLNVHARRDAAEGICEVGWCDCGEIGAVDSDGALQLHQADSILAALSEAGFVVVPAEPSDEMVERAHRRYMSDLMNENPAPLRERVSGWLLSALTPGGEK